MVRLLTCLALLLGACDLSNAGLGSTPAADAGAPGVTRGGQPPPPPSGAAVSPNDPANAPPTGPLPDPQPTPTDLEMSGADASTTPSTVVPEEDAGAPQSPVPIPTIVRAKDVKVGTLRATRLVARKVRTQTADVARIIEGTGDKHWEQERGDENLDVDELVADTVFAKDVRADRIEAVEIVVEELVVEPK